MSSVVCISVALVTVLLCLFSGSAVAQQTAPLSCSDAPSINFNASQISGTWYEVARNPTPANFLGCVELDVALLSDNTTLNINTTYGTMASMLYMNQTISTNLTVDNTNTNGYNITYNLGGASTAVPVLYKLLATDYNNYAFVCGYTNATDNSTSFGVVLTRQRMLSSSALIGYEVSAAASFSNFLNGTMYTVTQTDGCYMNSAATTVPILSAIFAAIYALLKFIN